MPMAGKCRLGRKAAEAHATSATEGTANRKQRDSRLTPGRDQILTPLTRPRKQMHSAS